MARIFHYGVAQESHQALAPSLVSGFAYRIASDTHIALRNTFQSRSVILQFKRGLAANLPASAAEGEPLYATDKKQMYVGTGSGLEMLAGADATAEVTTTDATQTTCGTLTLADNTSYMIEVYVAAISSANGDGHQTVARVHRINPGGATIGSQLELLDFPVWTVVLDTSGNDVRVRVTGAAATTIKWQAKIHVRAKRTL